MNLEKNASQLLKELKSREPNLTNFSSTLKTIALSNKKKLLPHQVVSVPMMNGSQSASGQYFKSHS
jgi:predicted DNA-binding ribbon-helix-helix protein